MNLLITGAAGAIGRAAAKRMAPRARIIAADRDGDGARALVAELKRDGYDACACEVDVRSSASVTALVEHIGRDVGPVDALFCSAGIYWSKPVEAITEDDWDAMIATHVKGAYLCAGAVLPQMRDRGAGAIVTMASDHAVAGLADNVAYAAAQSALYALTKSLAQAFAPHGIRINAIGAGPIEAPTLRAGRSQDDWRRFKAERAQRVPMGRLGRPEDVAAVLDFLLSERSAYLTGQIIHVNGGELIW